MSDTYLSVSAINKYIELKFKSDLNLKNVLLKGEISNFKPNSRGHFYFVIKDNNAQINAILFKNSSFNISEIKDGDEVLITGDINMYIPNGTFSIVCTKIEKAGLGELYQKFAELKIKLEKQGYFNIANKKEIPKYPQRIGIITAKTGAAVHDILTTIKRRYPICDVYLYPSIVQGSNAKDSLIANLEYADIQNLDVIIFGRGGGSLEDLWAFNEEEVANAIYHLKTPIISAVGHEVDFSISDFVADMRAATPTAAAELATPDLEAIINQINFLNQKVDLLMHNKIKTLQRILNSFDSHYLIKNPNQFFNMYNLKLDLCLEKIERLSLVYINNKKDKITYLNKQLQLLNPLDILNRGFAVIRQDQKVIKNANELAKTGNLELIFENSKLNISYRKEEK